MADMIQKALEFATEKHKLQKRTGGEPYVNHCIRVFNTVKDTFNIKDEDVLCAALLHDTIEDTDTTMAEVSAAFNLRTAQITDELTNKYSDHLEHKAKREATIEHVKKMSPEAKLVKVADRYDNITDFNGWKLARKARYCENTIAMIDALEPIPEVAQNMANDIKQICQNFLTNNQQEIQDKGIL